MAFLAPAQGGGGGALFPAMMEATIGEEKVTLVRTGTALRKKGIFKVYSVASYIEDGAKVTTAKELIDSDHPKRMHLHFLRGVSGSEMASAFRTIFRANHPEPKFKEEFTAMMDMFQKSSVSRGDNVYLIHVPKVGLVCKRPGRADVMFKNVEFSKAVWENYLGRFNPGEEVKQGLISELPR
jgi:hypothetical protein